MKYKYIADATRSKIVTVKENKSAVFDDVAYKAKEASLFPQKKVVPKEATKDSFDTLIVQARSIVAENTNE